MKEFKFARRKIPVLFRYRVGRSCEELESVVTREIAYMYEGHFGSENRSSAFDVGGHADARRRKINWEQNILNHFLVVASAPYFPESITIVSAAPPARRDTYR